MTPTPPSQADVFSRLVASFHVGILRLRSAEVASLSFALALLRYRGTGPVAPPTDNEVLQQLHGIDPEAYDAFMYVNNLSQLVYLTTLLDAFLTDATTFLFLTHPRSLGATRQVSLETVLGASSVTSILTETAVKRAREISFRTFLERLDILRTTFGLRIELDAEATNDLEHYPSRRNTVVHDQGVFQLSLNDDGSVKATRKACTRHPTHVSHEDINRARTCYKVVVQLVAQAVLSQVLHAPDHPVLRHFGPRAEPEVPPLKLPDEGLT